MGRKSHTRALSVWANGLRVGTWRMAPHRPMELQYDAEWVASQAGRPLSLSLPFGIDNAPLRGDNVQNYFDNLLPDSDPIRRRLATKYHTGSTDAFDLLEAIGRDCVGAVQLLEEDDVPQNVQCIDGTPQAEADIETLLNHAITSTGPANFSEEEDFRISIAGAQEKTALLFHEGQWLLPHGATPTTHILKLPIGLVGGRNADFTTSVENEWLCMQLFKELGLPTADCEIQTFGKHTVLVVSRFDRQMHSSGKWIMRLPQEDFCQAFGVPSHLKYENVGGPSMIDIASTLRQSETAEEDLRTFFTAQVLFWMFAATDGHAKNFSIHLLPGGRYKLTPLYDIMTVWPIIGDGPNQVPYQKARLAMAVASKNRHYHLNDIKRRHFNAMAPKCFYGQSAEPLLRELLAQVPTAVANVADRLPPNFPAAVADRLFEGIRGSLETLEKEAA
ncbi:HipA domain-containing protein [Cupriavidus sp. P-10]|uniref:HipA domain-containing protein n=1 Tax=Cupriavidus sp. P-10 TaxID=2027911 RepID=UPI000E2F96FC|nr:type II toxin-antitoxin system HipA family toxin [Cupriavidus sp. P-10]